jgi:hypothetical protein
MVVKSCGSGGDGDAQLGSEGGLVGVGWQAQQEGAGGGGGQKVDIPIDLYVQGPGKAIMWSRKAVDRDDWRPRPKLQQLSLLVFGQRADFGQKPADQGVIGVDASDRHVTTQILNSKFKNNFIKNERGYVYPVHMENESDVLVDDDDNQW